MRTLIVAAFAASLVISTAAAQEHDPDNAVADGGVIADGWQARPDRGSLDNVNFRVMGDGWHVTLGPALILYRASDVARGSYEVSGTFAQTRAPRHPEAYGLIMGGRDLEGDGQRYTYFLIRGDGSFLVKRRDGSGTSNVSDGWARHDAVHAADAEGRARNELSIRVAGGNVSFMVNGTEVFTAPASDLDTGGIAGMRVNHNLDLHIGSFAVRQM